MHMVAVGFAKWSAMKCFIRLVRQKYQMQPGSHLSAREILVAGGTWYARNRSLQPRSLTCQYALCNVCTCVAICDTSYIRVVPLYASLIDLVVGAVETEGQHTNNAAMSRWDSGSSS